MISDAIIDFKLAKPRNKLNHEFHAQVGICADNGGNQISFDGSYNDSEIGLHNYESLKVFRSWDGTKSYVEQEEQLFDCIWNNDDPNIEVYDAPNVVKSHILELREASERPYPTGSVLRSIGATNLINASFLLPILSRSCTILVLYY